MPLDGADQARRGDDPVAQAHGVAQGIERHRREPAIGHDLRADRIEGHGGDCNHAGHLGAFRGKDFRG
jgi:hypothetical protein